eukprot:847262-Alexandrium_andersonii.AAC.1
MPRGIQQWLELARRLASCPMLAALWDGPGLGWAISSRSYCEWVCAAVRVQCIRSVPQQRPQRTSFCRVLARWTTVKPLL